MSSLPSAVGERVGVFAGLERVFPYPPMRYLAVNVRERNSDPDVTGSSRYVAETRTFTGVTCAFTTRTEPYQWYVVL